MAKNLIRTQFRGDLAGGAPTGVQIIETFEYVDDDTQQAITTKDTVRDATVQELEAIVTPSVASVGAANATLTAQNVALQAQVANLNTRLEAAVLALAAVAYADTSWDNGVRAGVTAVLEAEVAP